MYVESEHLVKPMQSLGESGIHPSVCRVRLYAYIAAVKSRHQALDRQHIHVPVHHIATVLHCTEYCSGSEIELFMQTLVRHISKYTRIKTFSKK